MNSAVLILGWVMLANAMATAHSDASPPAPTGSPCDAPAERYSVLAPRPRASDCIELTPAAPPQNTFSSPNSNDELVHPDWIATEMLAFSVIGIAQIRGGTELLRNIWYAAAVLAPPLLPHDPEYGYKKSYLAITPAFLALGAMNDYLRRDAAEHPRIFASNFIGFNLAIMWSRTVLNRPEHFFGVPARVRGIHGNAAITPLINGVALHLSLQW